jgi:hypothetical protein
MTPLSRAVPAFFMSTNLGKIRLLPPLFHPSTLSTILEVYSIEGVSTIL